MIMRVERITLCLFSLKPRGRRRHREKTSSRGLFSSVEMKTAELVIDSTVSLPAEDEGVCAGDPLNHFIYLYVSGGLVQN